MDLAAAKSVDFWILECVCPVSTIRQRLSDRVPQALDTDARIEVFEAQLAAYEPITDYISTHGSEPRRLAVHTAGSLKSAVHAALHALLHRE